MTLLPGFHPGIYIRSYHGTNDLFSKLRPAYEFMRLTEDAPIAPRCGSTILSERVLGQTAEWFARHDVVRTLTLACRLVSAKLIDTFLTRHRVAAMPMAIIEELHAISVRAVQGAVGRAQVVGEGQEAGIAQRAEAQLEASLSILARVALRLPPPLLGQLLNLPIN